MNIIYLSYLATSMHLVSIGSGPPTPHYNSSVLSDMFLESHLHHLYKCVTECPGMKDAVVLVKVWLHQRGLGKVRFVLCCSF